ncbi:MAG: hypothetical protein IJ920_02540 [Paludibacteraceae bacterium]|nr:hypothetical protein [Paludibacteraceae bacterium]
MKKNIFALATLCLAFAFTACTPNAPSEESCYLNENQVKEWTADGTIYNLNDFLDKFMTEKGDFEHYRTRSEYKHSGMTLYLFSIDTIPTNGEGVYIRGRVATDDYGGNFYKSIVLQQIVNGEQQALRISVDMGSASGLYQKGQEVIIRCNGLAVGRYANQPQLCVPSYNNNVYASHANEKIGWAPGRIPSPRFREACKLIGTPDASKLVYKRMFLSEFEEEFQKHSKMDSEEEVKRIRRSDGMLVRIDSVYFSGKFNNQGDMLWCTFYVPATDSTEAQGDPEVDGSNAWVFAPSTGNVGYPQSRYVTDGSMGSFGSRKVLIAASEYAKYAHYYLPKKKYKGYVQGVLGYYMDNGRYEPDEKNWSITPNNMVEDILPDCQKATDPDKRWKPQEWVKGIPQDTIGYK